MTHQEVMQSEHGQQCKQSSKKFKKENKREKKKRYPNKIRKCSATNLISQDKFTNPKMSHSQLIQHHMSNSVDDVALFQAQKQETFVKCNAQGHTISRST